ncbi:biotin--[acetyl-CoA-carboxylase] ligase [Roseomonas xinghualingensis]|uniref:biotin--[acetyl-CoA-carboxylase] ligase n=1 Tax=Roseomonas xinghualingensis TaxID=2986475 RepID=UPI0021F18F47|nr:biotin--[acetyl-CoA-carboxylase] ligase [Roseomonas sp. SXEYE001]MCV4206767.1 biotin--[acetyl-CoA-carboxylase] ligase [Roseomonas sp. SXEYE001]
MSAPAAGWRLLVHDQLPSTADLIRERAEDGEAERLAILARRQTAGRGTHGRVWHSPEGNLYLSVLLRPDAAAREVPQWSLLAAVALHEALAPHAGPGLALKWPNDLLLDGAKCAGILSEAALDAAGRLAWLSFGFGVNLAFAPEVPGRRTAALPLPSLAPEEAAFAIMASLDRWRAVREEWGFGAIREAWLARGHGAGDALTVTARGILHHGCFEGLDETGALRLRTATGLETVTAGEVNP